MKRSFNDIYDTNEFYSSINNKLCKINNNNEKIYINQNDILYSLSSDEYMKTIIYILNDLKITEMLFNFKQLDINFYIYKNNNLLFNYPLSIDDLIILQYHKILKSLNTNFSVAFVNILHKLKTKNLFINIKNNSKFMNEYNDLKNFLYNKI
jgi:hypothetical protein